MSDLVENPKDLFSRVVTSIFSFVNFHVLIVIIHFVDYKHCNMFNADLNLFVFV